MQKLIKYKSKFLAYQFIYGSCHDNYYLLWWLQETNGFVMHLTDYNKKSMSQGSG